MVQGVRFLEVWERVKKETDITTFTQLAEIVGTTHQYVSRKKTKDEFPVSWAFVIAQKYGLSTDWIMTGAGKKYLYKNQEINPLLEEVNDWLNEEKKHESETFKILFNEQMIRAFFDFEAWQEEKKGKAETVASWPASKVA